MPASKDDPMPESTMRLIWDCKAAHDEETRLRDAWIEHVNSTYPRDSGEADPASAFSIAERIVEAHNAGRLEDAHEETPRLARAYIEAIRKRQDAWSMIEAEYAVSHPELLDDLTRDREPTDDPSNPEP